MGLDKSKSIVTRNQFSKDPFKADNLVYAAQSKSSMPTSIEEIRLDKQQSIYYSIEHALKRLVQNDMFIDQFQKKSQNQVSAAVENGLISAFDTDVTTQPGNTQIYDNYLSTHIAEYHTVLPYDAEIEFLESTLFRFNYQC